MSVFKIAFANMRKRKGAVVTLMIMVMIAALMLSAGLSLAIGAGSLFETKIEELNAPHYRQEIYLGSYEDEHSEYASTYSGVTAWSVTNTVFATGDWVSQDGKNLFSEAVYFGIEAEVKETFFAPKKIIDEYSASRSKDSIIAPLKFKYSGVKPGEKIILKAGGNSYTFTLQGFFEESAYSGGYGTDLSYISQDFFDELTSAAGFATSKSLSVRFSDYNMSIDFRKDFRERFQLTSAESPYVLMYDEMEEVAMSNGIMLTTMLMIFALVVLVIAFIVANFNVKTALAEDIKNIGSLKSVGYTSKILRRGQLAQNFLVSFMGGILGAVISFFAVDFLSRLITNTSGLLWTGSSAVPIISTTIAVCLLIVFIAFLASRKYKKITPVDALRQGDGGHSYRKNHVPLSKHQMPLNLHLGFKRFFGNFKSNIIFSVVLALLVFLCILATGAHYNLNVDRTMMTNMVGMEMAEVWIVPNSEAELGIEEIRDDIQTRFSNEVKSTLLVSNQIECLVDDYDTLVDAVEDFDKLTIKTVFKGSYPQKDDEIVLNTVTAGIIGKGIGDRVNLKLGSVVKEYQVVGLSQGVANTSLLITPAAMAAQMGDDFKMNIIYVYLNDGINVQQIRDEFTNTYSGTAAVDTQKQLVSILDVQGETFSLLTIVMIIVTVLVVVFVLFLLVSTLVRRQKKELGIMKAIGFKNRQLILQLLISYLPALILGTIIGLAVGFTVTNPLLAMMVGLGKGSFIIPAGISIGLGLGVFGLSVLMIVFVALRLRKITAHKLIVAN